MAACWRLLASHVFQLFGSSKNEFHEGDGSSVRTLPIAAVLQWGPCLPPQYLVFSHQREAGRAGAGQQQSFVSEGFLVAAIFFLLVVSGLSECKEK